MARIITAAVLAIVAATPGQAAPRRTAPPAAAPAAAPTVRGAVDLWRAGDYAGAVAMWTPFANAGDPDAMFNIGQAYKLGRAVPKDPVIARDWYRRAAMKGHLPAQANLGILLFQAGEKAEAVRWLKAAADKGEMRAQYVLGVANWNGDGLPRNLTLAYAYLQRAAAQGLAEASPALASLTPMMSPLERANGWAVATSLAGGNGVPPEFGGPPTALASNDSYRRDQVIKPLPAAAPVRPAPVIVAVPAALTPVPAVPTPAAAVPAGPATAGSVAVAAAPPATAAPLPPKPAAPVPIVIARTPPPAGSAVPVAAPRPVAPPVATFAVPASSPAPVAVKPATPVVVASATASAPAARPLPQVATAAPAPAPAAAPAKSPTAPVNVAAAKPVPKEPTGWRVQLGAFSKKALAEAAWTDVKTKQKQLIGTSKPIYNADGSVTKLQMGPYASKAAARDACARLAFTGQACFVTEG